MTSLQHQLKKLKKAPTGALAVERDYSSLLFDRKEAAAHDRDDFYKIGLAGLKGMKWLDNDFDTYEPELFEKKMLNFNRALLSQEEAEEFDQRIEAIILRLCPYFHHQSCRQVLEWLIHKYQVHSYNAQTLFLAFLPYHNQNSFGRLLRILRFNSPGMDWLAEFQKSGAPLPLNVLSRACQSGKSYWMVSALSSFVQKMLTILESPYVDAKLHHYFTFLVSLFGSLLENQVGKPDEQFISRLVVFLGSALKSKLNSYKCAGTMLFCSLAVNVPISEETANSLLELLLFKVRAPLCQLVLEATNVVCERLAISSLPKKQIMWLVYRSPELGLADLIREMMGSYNMTAFLVPFWKILMEELATGEKEDWREHFTDLLITSLDLEQMDDAQARAVFGLLLDWVENAVDSGFEKQTKVLPKKLRTHVRAMAIRFPVAFNGMRTSRRLENIQRLMEECLIQSHEVEPLESMDSGKGSKKKRKKQRHSREEPEREEGHSSRKLRLESPD